EGYNVLYPVGFDALGLPAENAAIKRGIDPRQWTYGNIAHMREQLRSMGNSFDWSREVVTADPEYYRWTQWLFLKLFGAGLAERKKAPVNWCPSCETGLANEQVLKQQRTANDGQLITVSVCERCETPVEQRELEQWFLKITKYADRLLDDLAGLDWPEEIKEAQRNWIGRSEGVVIKFEIRSTKSETNSKSEIQNSKHAPVTSYQLPVPSVEVFTTRPDTLFGATYLVLAPEHAFISEIKDQKSKLQFQIQNGEEVEAYIERARNKTELERVVERGEKTGVELKGITAVNPANGEEIPVWISDYVLAHYGTGAIMGVPGHDERDFAFARLHDLPIKMVVCPHYPTPTCPVLDHAYTGEGHLVGSGEFDELPSGEARRAITKHVGGTMTATYRLHDWLISRQRYWGCPIPIVYNPEGKAHPVPEEHLPWLLPDDVTDFTPKGTSPLGTSQELVARTERIFGKGWRPEIDTLDAFVDSSWYFLRYLDPHNDREFASRDEQALWMPVDRYSGGAEHTTMHVLYSRFFYKAMHDLGLVASREARGGSDPPQQPRRVRPSLATSEPYAVRMNRGLVLGTDGRKMSKRWGNVIDPDAEVARVGADAVRMYLAFIGPYNEAGHYPWQTGGLIGMRRFLEKVWKLKSKIKNQKSKLQLKSENVRQLIHKTIRKVGDDIEAFKFNTALSALMILVNAFEKEEEVGREHYETLLVLLAPFAPHLAEELWESMDQRGSIHSEPWPTYDRQLLGVEQRIVVQVDGKVRATFESVEDLDEAAIVARAQVLPALEKYLAGRKIRRTIYISGRLLNIVLE
ncbi:MAG: leucine--tRNA ligase, partial [Patescibacteria group bacterium]|nr:leucine--tRNA ligase [Patescibacteria group bacterium]